jgi:uncharacterized surface protein with fasciclin (FAS1) repeats
MCKLKLILYLSAFSLLLTNCRKDMDDYYDRPSSLADPIYQQLEAKGNFTSFLSLIDRTGYKDILSSGGYWTCFAPNDSAFKVYLAEHGYTSATDIDSVTAKKIVRFMLVYNAYDSARLDDYQTYSGWVTNNAFRRKTAYYKWVYSDTTLGVVRLVMDNINNSSSIDADENNNKYIPYFTDNYFSMMGLSTSDYTYFYPNATFSEINIAGGNVIGTGVEAENGYYYQINKVIEPLSNIYEYIKSQSSYSTFKGLLDKFARFTINDDFQARYLEATGLSATVYHKEFSDTLAFSPNGECYLRNTTYDAQNDCWTIFVPSNDAVLEYEKTVLAEYYDNDPDQIPDIILAEFINAHMWQTSVWPSNFSSSYNYLGESSDFDASSEVTEAKILSNGFFYGVNRVHKSNTFSTVYAQAFLNPSYAYMLRLMGSTYKSLLTKKTKTYTVFMVADDAYATRDFTYNTIYSTWWWFGASSISNQWVSTATEKITRDFKLQIVEGDLDDVSSGEGIVKTYGGECIKYKNGVVYGAGNQDSSRYANVTGYRDYDNGRVYFLDNMLEYSEVSPAGHLRELAGYNPSTGWGTPTQFYKYYKYLTVSGLLTVTSSDSSRMLISGVSSGDYYTFFVPTGDSIASAVSKGNLPAVTATDDASISVIKQFIKYHIVNKILIADGDEDDDGTANTAYKDVEGNTKTVKVSNEENNLVITGLSGTSATPISGYSNNLSSMAVIHLVNRVLSVE